MEATTTTAAAAITAGAAAEAEAAPAKAAAVPPPPPPPPPAGGGRRSWGQRVRAYHSGAPAEEKGGRRVKETSKKAMTTAPGPRREKEPTLPPSAVDEAEEEVGNNDSALMMRSILSVDDDGGEEAEEVNASQFSRASASSSRSSSSRWGQSARRGGGAGSSRWGGSARSQPKAGQKERVGAEGPVPPPPPPPPPVLADVLNETVDTNDLLDTTPMPEPATSVSRVSSALLGKIGFDDSHEADDSLLLGGGIDSSADHSSDVYGGLTTRRLEREQREAATVIQTAQRASAGRRRYVQLRKTVQATILVQSLARGAAERQDVERQHRAATTIQAHARGMAGREEVIRYCTHIEQTAAATKIQNSYRAHIAVTEKSLAQQAGATVAIQALARGCQERKSLAQQAGATVASIKDDRAERIAKVEAEVERLESTSPVAKRNSQTTPGLSSISNDSTTGSDATSIDIESEIAQAFDLGQEALRSAPEKEDSCAPVLASATKEEEGGEAKEEIDDAKISRAKSFLTHPNTAALPMEDKTKYLLSKGLSEAEIKASLEAVARDLVLEEGTLYDDMGTEVTMERSLNIQSHDLKQKDTADTDSNASTTDDKSSLDVPSGDTGEDIFESETKANKAALNASVVSQKLNKSFHRMKEMDVKLPSCGCVPSHMPNRVVVGLVLFMIFLAVGLYLIYKFAVGGLS